MRYFVVTPSGSYGPADVALLTQWASEGRLDQGSILEEEGTGRKLTAGSIGIGVSSFQHAPAGGNVVTPLPAATSLGPMQPPPPMVVSNYRRPDYEPPLFLAHEVDGRKELRYCFIFAVAAPLVALVHVYGIAMAFGGIYCGVIAYQRGKKLGLLGVLFNIMAVPLAFLLRFGFAWFF